MTEKQTSDRKEKRRKKNIMDGIFKSSQHWPNSDPIVYNVFSYGSIAVFF